MLRIALSAVLLLTTPSLAAADEWFVAPDGAGAGTSRAPFARVQDGLNAAQPGDVVTVLPGTYAERLATMRNGTAEARIVVRAQEPGSVIVTAPGRTFTVGHSYVTVEGFVFDGQYGPDDTIRVTAAGDHFHLAHSEVRRSTRDLIDMGAPDGVLIEHCVIHHALNAAGGRTDAHGVVAGAVRGLTIRDSQIHTFSGDGVQVDPGRAAPGWSDVTIERTRIWLTPLPEAENGFDAGTVPGENAVDTKANPRFPRAVLVLRDVVAWGFRDGLISNMAAFNLKEHVDATIDRVTVYDSEIAFRLRGAPTGGARVRVSNALVYDTQTAFRYEDDIQDLRIWNATLGRGIGRPFQAAASSKATLDVRNLLVLGPLPREAIARSNLSVGPEAFRDAAAHDYSLSEESAAIDAGETIPEVETDITGAARPDTGYDVGAYERAGAGGLARRRRG